jgi:hypothetical protein
MTVPKRTPPKKPQTAATAISKGSRKDQGDEHGRAMSDADLRLRIEMIPRPLWGRNVRTMMGPTQWRKLTALLEKKHLGCNICGSLQGPFHAHEEWDYKEGRSRGVATLKWVKRVCQDCHSIIHIGRTNNLLLFGSILPAEWERLVAHFQRVNDCDTATFKQHFGEARSVWRRRSNLTWTIDCSKFLRPKGPLATSA